MRKIELLSPAGDLEKLKIAIIYGADAVYIGGMNFSLRARSSNFTIDDIEEACDFARQYNSKVYVTTNILPHNNDLEGLEEYLINLKKSGVSAVICASPSIINVANKVGIEVHLSTQASTTNTKSMEFWKNHNVKRVVTARELSLDEIELVRKNTDMDIEVFIHGGMCVSYSGRCTLSNHMTDRDANRGGCAHSCRWNYDFYTDKKYNEELSFSMSSKDLNAIDYITRLIDIGVDSLKIEGRMKSVHYIATVVGTYRKLIDDYIKNGEVDMDYYRKEILKAENRLTSIGFFEGDPNVNEQLYNMRSEKPTQTFIGYVLEYSNGYAVIEERNKFEKGCRAEIFGPNIHEEFIIEEILDEDGNSIDVAKHPKQILKIKVPFKVNKHDMIRKVVEV
ncbi:U32 family peptidase [Mycoplasmatota bacterium WC44]